MLLNLAAALLAFSTTVASIPASTQPSAALEVRQTGCKDSYPKGQLCVCSEKNLQGNCVELGSDQRYGHCALIGDHTSSVRLGKGTDCMFWARADCKLNDGEDKDREYKSFADLKGFGYRITFEHPARTGAETSTDMNLDPTWKSFTCWADEVDKCNYRPPRDGTPDLDCQFSMA